MSTSTVRVDLGPRGYDIAVTSNALDGLGPFARQRCQGALAFVVTDENVRPHADRAGAALKAAGFQCNTVILPHGEAQKALGVASMLYDTMVNLHADRRTLVVAVGGGVIGDLAGFVAATFNRGVPLLMVPTTLLAMVDSSVGGKVAVNHPKGKNLIGVFHQPIGVWIDTAVLATLPERDYRSGLAEVVKYGVILDADFFGWLEANADAVLRRDAAAIRHVVTRCCRLKADVVEKDEREETGVRAALNYGHTFAHAFETAAGYGGWQHGEAVAAGMICASRLAERLGRIDAELTHRQRTLLERFGLPTQPERWPTVDLLATMRSDKKAVAGKMRFVLPSRLGAVELVDGVPEEIVATVLNEKA
ncbi:MAG TPA: 3-dehydroquinate synthase [Gemmataceae bacterium]|nr:3-dehydroquinate synthase [Gemmataceae bacterium]